MKPLYTKHYCNEFNLSYLKYYTALSRYFSFLCCINMPLFLHFPFHGFILRQLINFG